MTYRSQKPDDDLVQIVAMLIFLLGIVCIVVSVSGCAHGPTNDQKDCSHPEDCAPLHHSGGQFPTPNIARPLERGQFIRVYPAARTSPLPIPETTPEPYAVPFTRSITH